MIEERQLTRGPIQKHLDNNLNFSRDGKHLSFDCRPNIPDLGASSEIGVIEVDTGEVEIIYRLPTGQGGLGAVSWLNAGELIMIHPLAGLKYEQTQRAGRIIPANGSTSGRWLDSRNTLAPFTPGALRGGTHKHEPDGSGEWVGFTYNDHTMKTRNRSDLRNVGVTWRRKSASVENMPSQGCFTGEGFSVLLTACVDQPMPGSDEIHRAEGDCWIGRSGFLDSSGKRVRARAFRGLVCTAPDELAYDVFMVTVPSDITQAGSGPLQGTLTEYPSPPKGVRLQRLTYTARSANPLERGVLNGTLRCPDDGSCIAYCAPARCRESLLPQIFVVSPISGEVRQISNHPAGVTKYLRFAPNGKYIAAITQDGALWVWAAITDMPTVGVQLSPIGTGTPRDVVISPDSTVIAYNRDVAGMAQVFICRAPED